MKDVIALKGGYYLILVFYPSQGTYLGAIVQRLLGPYEDWDVCFLLDPSSLICTGADVSYLIYFLKRQDIAVHQPYYTCKTRTIVTLGVRPT